MAPTICLGLGDLVPGTVVARPNRFTVVVDMNGLEVRAHMADPGRLRELIFPGSSIMVRKAVNSDPGTFLRKTTHDVVLVKYREQVANEGDVPGIPEKSDAGEVWVSVDTRYPNKLFARALEDRAICEFSAYTGIRREYPVPVHLVSVHAREDTHAPNQESPAVRRRPASRIDFFLTGYGVVPALVEVKSVTLCRKGVGLFPDAPTERGTRHVRHLMESVEAGYLGYVVFIAQRGDVDVIMPNAEVDPEFAAAVQKAQEAGVRLLGFRCRVSPEAICLDTEILPVVPA